MLANVSRGCSIICRGRYHLPVGACANKFLPNVLYMDRVNDISFTLDGKYVVLLEQQSTIKMNCKFCAIINGEHEISGDARKYFSYANCRFIEYHRNEQNEIDGATIACDLGHGYGFDNVEFYIGPIIPENWK